MRILPSLFAFLLLAVAACNNASTTPQTATTDSAKTSFAPDDAAIKKAVDNAYRVISFKQGETLNYESIRTAFVPQAQFLNFRTDTLDVLRLDDFINAYKGFVQSAGIKSFYEVEAYGRTDQYGRIAQRISTYKSYINTMDTVGERGVNSFQLVKAKDGWKVSSIIWDVEKPSQPIPSIYLGADRANK